MHLLLSNAMKVESRREGKYHTSSGDSLYSRQQLPLRSVLVLLDFISQIPLSRVEIEVKPRSFEGHTAEEWREWRSPEGKVDRFRATGPPSPGRMHKVWTRRP